MSKNNNRHTNKPPLEEPVQETTAGRLERVRVLINTHCKGAILSEPVIYKKSYLSFVLDIDDKAVALRIDATRNVQGRMGHNWGSTPASEFLQNQLKDK